MTDDTNSGEKKLSLGTLSLKKPADGVAGSVRQSFSHGRSNTVAVEVVKRRAPGAPPQVGRTTTQQFIPAPESRPATVPWP